MELKARCRLLDLSHPIESGMTTYPGLPGPVVGDFWSRESTRGKYAEGTTFQIGRVEMIANTGTYLDAPFHRFETGEDVGSLALETLADLPGLCVDATVRQGRALGPEIFRGRDIGGHAVLFSTGWDAHWRTPGYGQGNPYLTRGAAQLLVSAKASLVGIDSVNIDDTQDPERPAHTLLLGAGIPIVEHLRGLFRLPAENFRFHAVPAPLRGMGSFPVRAYALISQ